jgi:NADPH:quinone reductase-like Zn-dependent oxidoreductase
MHSRFPATFPSGEGSDFAGVVKEIGADVTKFKVGDEVAGHTDNRASHAEYVVVSENNLVAKPKSVSWEEAGSLWVAGTTAYACVKAVGVKSGDKVVVSGAAGGVGSIAIQLAKLAGGEVYGIAGDHDHDWLKSLGIVPISYSGDVPAQIKSLVGTPDAFIDTVGKGYVKLAMDLGVAPERINTVIDFEAVEKYRVKSDGSAAAADNKVLEQLLTQIAEGVITIPIAKTFALKDVQEAFKFIDEQHHRGKVVLLP